MVLPLERKEVKQVYRSANEFEAQMLCNLMEQAGIEAHLSGEHIQGIGASVQPIQIFVPEEDFGLASRIVEEGNLDFLEEDPQIRRFGPEPGSEEPSLSRNSVKIDANDHHSARQTDWTGVLLGLLVGILLGAGGMFWAYNSPVEENGVDYDGDGRLDETWIYVDERLSRVDLDSNLDGEVDEISHYDHLEFLELIQSDHDFNGTFETEYYYEDSFPTSYRQDSDDDGFFEYQEQILPDGLAEGTYFHPKSKKPIKTISYNYFKMLESRLDLNGDGTMDVIRKYNDIDEEVSEERIQ
ncbi:MAG TPA: hypothetical protein DEA96_04895 [Leptospiraceae bacterium]|nr:hypothetical protein [Spirochaetaceae bacterium]HBS04281.1 hypothetical protein [Leptospiraceae bacterium]|tara:strand:+ start:76720 stop:77610 length:891 start_codon:yes stop_codon:yes gene_type:complete